jgi:hypothetical protein
MAPDFHLKTQGRTLDAATSLSFKYQKEAVLRIEIAKIALVQV